MDLEIKLYLEKAKNKLVLAKTNFEISTSEKLKRILNIPLDNTFFSDVISQSYYAIFYTAKAYLLSKSIKITPPEEHKKTYKKFRRFVKSGEIDQQLLDIYEEESKKAESLLKIFKLEKSKRGKFTYNVNANANIPYAKESIENSRRFCSIMRAIIEEENRKKQDEKEGEGENV